MGLGWVAAEYWDSAGFLVFFFGVKGKRRSFGSNLCFLFPLFAKNYTRDTSTPVYSIHSDSLFQKVLIHFFILMLCTSLWIFASQCCINNTPFFLSPLLEASLNPP